MLVAGCAANPADKSTSAEVKAPASPGAASISPQAGARTYVTAEGSTIGFVGSKVTGKHDGGFKKFTGQFALANGSLSGVGHKATIDMDSLWADNNRVAGHLKNQDFFDVAKFPQAVFEILSLEKADGAKFKVTGNLTLHGVTKQIGFLADFQAQGDQATLKTEFFIKRFDFEVKYKGRANDLVRDEVVIKLDIKAKAQG